MERGRIVFCIFLAACGVWLLQSCGRKEREPDASCDKVRLAEYECKGDCGNPLCGRWRWVSSGGEVEHLTPANTGHCQVLHIWHDSTWRLFIDGQLMDTGRYTTERKVAPRGWGGEVNVPYSAIRLLSRYKPPRDFSKYKKDGIVSIVGISRAYNIEGRNLYFGSPPGVVGGVGHTWLKQ